MRRLLLVTVATALLVSIGTTLGPATASAETAATAVRHVDPLDSAGDLSPAYTIAHHYGDANCVIGSPTTGTAYQCFSSQSREGVFDTCWVEADPAFVACLANPWTHQVTRLHVTGGYDNRTGTAHVAAPWAVRLRLHRLRCLVELGSVKTADGHPITYRCPKKILITGAVTRRGSTWRAQTYRRVTHKGADPTFTSLGLQPVAIAWRGSASRKA